MSPLSQQNIQSWAAGLSIQKCAWFCMACLCGGVLPAEDTNPINTVVQEFRSRHTESPEPPVCSDAQFLRRVHLDLTGYPPLPKDIVDFQADDRAAKRSHLIARLAASERYSWKWGRWLTLQTGADEQELSYAASEMQCTPQDLFLSWLQWIQKHVQNDEPYDRIVENCLLATSREGRKGTEYYAELQAIAAADQLQVTAYDKRQSNDLFWRRYSAIYDPEFRAEDVALRFLGIDLQCARCHDHPSQPLTMEDHKQFTAVFEPLRYSEMPFSNLYKQLMLLALATLAAAIGVLILRGLRRSQTGDSFLRRLFLSSAPTVIATSVVIVVSYLHLLPGITMMQRTSPGQLLLAGAASVQLPAVFFLLLVPVLMYGIVAGASWLFARDLRQVGRRRCMIWLTPLCLLLLADAVYVMSQHGDLGTRKGSLHALHHTVFRWLGIDGCGQQPREIFVSDSPASLQVVPKLLNGPTVDPDLRETDLRKPLMHWLREPNVPLLDQHYINMVWSEYFGEPLQPVTLGGEIPNAESESESSEQQFRSRLMSALRTQFRSHNWSMRHLHVLIVSSELYSQSSQREGSDTADRQMPHWFYAFPVRRLSIEQYLACVEVSTGGILEFGRDYARSGATAYQVSSRYPWSDTFGATAMRILTTSTTDRDFSSEAAMFGLVEPGMLSQIMRPDGCLAQSLVETKDFDELIEDAYIRCFGRLPSETEISGVHAMWPDGMTQQQYGGEILWALLNSAECQYLF